MVKVGGKKVTRKVCKFWKVGGIRNFRESGGKCSHTGETGGKFEICGWWPKKRSSEILADENRKFCREKVTFQKFHRKSKKISKTGGKSETGGNASWPQGGWTPLAFGSQMTRPCAKQASPRYITLINWLAVIDLIITDHQSPINPISSIINGT